MTLKLICSFLLALVTASAQFWGTGRDPRWQTVGAGALSSRPSTCKPNKHVYICNGGGCGINGEYHYCTAPNVWSVLSAADPSAVILTGTHAARPTAAVAGRVYLPSDGTWLQRDSGSAWVTWGPALPLTAPPALSDFVWVNQGGATASDSNGAIFLRAPTSSTDNLRILKLQAPSPPYTIKAGFLPALIGANSVSAGLIFREASSGKLQICGLAYDSGVKLQVVKYTNPTTWAATYLALDGGTEQGKPGLWLAASDDATNRNCYVSGDLSNWIRFFSIARTDFLTATEVGIYVNVKNSSYEAGLTMVSWKVE
jgi:hypothetical protein